MENVNKIIIFQKFTDIPDWEDIQHKIPIFATQEYADYLYDLKNTQTIWFVEINEGLAEFLIPFAVKKKYNFTKGYFLTAINNLKDASIEKENDFLESIVRLIKKKKLCDWIQQSPNWAIFKSFPKGAVFTEFGTYKINLKEKNEEELFNSIHTKDRSDIRKAIKDDVQIVHGIHLLDTALALITDVSIKARIMAPSIMVLETLRNNIHVFVSYLHGIPQSATIFYSNDFSWYTMYAGTKDRPSRGSNTLLYWMAIKIAKVNNVNYFDFVGARINPESGSKQERIQRFKEHFGVDLYKGYLWKMPINKLKYTIYRLGIQIYFKVKNREYRGDIIDQELRRLNK